MLHPVAWSGAGRNRFFYSSQCKNGGAIVIVCMRSVLQTCSVFNRVKFSRSPYEKSWSALLMQVLRYADSIWLISSRAPIGFTGESKWQMLPMEPIGLSPGSFGAVLKLRTGFYWTLLVGTRVRFLPMRSLPKVEWSVVPWLKKSRLSSRKWTN